MKKKSNLFAGVLIFSILFFLTTACVDKDTESENNNSTSSEASDSLSFLPDVNYNEEEIIFLCENDGTCKAIYAEELDSTLINDSVYQRNNIVQEKLGVVIKSYYGDTTITCLDMLRNSINSGLDEYDIVMPYMPAAATMALDQNLYDLNEIPELNLSAPYWDQNANEGLSIGGKLYFTVGAMTYSDKSLTLTYIFNKDVVEEKNLENPYILVKEGKWTIDKMIELAKQVTDDSDGNGVMNYKDTWGLFMNTSCASVYYLAAGEKLTSKDKYDLPLISVYTKRGVEVFNKIFEVYTDSTATIKIEGFHSDAIAAGYSTCYEAANIAFVEKRALFKTMNLSDLTPLGEYEVNFGILPYPKFDEQQTNYFSPVSLFYVTPVCIPISNKEPAKAAYVIEAMSAASVDTVEKSYYDVLLKLRQIQDAESKEMLDIIFANRVYDLSMIYNWGGNDMFDPNGVFWFMNQIADSGVNTFASTYESLKAAMDKGVSDTIAAFYS
ncbi:MAG: hypothetical protein A2Y17_06515 [Clostridiales bacterium GWF2_38_85]|nr:MAG: hypothetical protein A2Y17_06515 [Clostridiales bacterium GWF2_38_85]HBL84493.1 hypothetical protein [Clostridiales bacterium]